MPLLRRLGALAVAAVWALSGVTVQAATPGKPVAKPAGKPAPKPAAKPVAKPQAKPIARPVASPAPKSTPTVAPPLAKAAAVTAAGAAAATVSEPASRPAVTTHRVPDAAAPATAAASGAAKAAPMATSTAAATADATAASAMPAMPNRPDQVGWCRAIAAYKPDIAEARCRAVRLQAGDGRSVRGVPLWLADIPPPSGTPARLRVLVLGGMHADEGASVSLVFDWMQRVTKATSARVHWRMAPLINPDGFARKPATRVNARGVDLNRNFATHEWNARAQKYWVDMTKRDPRRYPGTKALSEPESQWVHRQIQAFRPNLIVSVHAPYGVLDFDGPPPAPDRLGNLFLDQVGVYPGSLGNYGGMVLGVPVVTIELKHSTEVPTREAAAMWDDLQGWIDRRLLNVAGAAHTEPPGRTGR